MALELIRKLLRLRPSAIDPLASLTDPQRTLAESFMESISPAAKSEFALFIADKEFHRLQVEFERNPLVNQGILRTKARRRLSDTASFRALARAVSEQGLHVLTTHDLSTAFAVTTFREPGMPTAAVCQRLEDVTIIAGVALTVSHVEADSKHFLRAKLNEGANFVRARTPPFIEPSPAQCSGLFHMPQLESYALVPRGTGELVRGSADHVIQLPLTQEDVFRGATTIVNMLQSSPIR